jgi:hypothetical protein
MKNRRFRSIVILFCTTLTPLFFALTTVNATESGLTIYPAKGQTPEQQKQDQGYCRQWAMEQTGFDPSQKTLPQVQMKSSVGGQTVKGAAGGALIGTGIGAIAGSAGKGAAIGAATGGAALGIKENKSQKQRDAEYQQYLAKRKAETEQYNKAQSACLEGRGYTVR